MILLGRDNWKLGQSVWVQLQFTHQDTLYVQAIQLKELKKIAALGAGAFGQVFLVKHGSKYYALKCLSKALVMETGLQVSNLQL